MGKEISTNGFGITPKLFKEWRSPRLGHSNPTRMDNTVWEWLIRTGKSAYQATQELDGPSSFSNGPTWCFDRFGQTCTDMPDGRKIYIGGEHEDYYDPDFYIYNDVIVINPDDSIEIYVYPKEIFPPTDFHTATLVGDTILIIGNLGYQDERQYGNTQVCILDTNDYSIQLKKTSGGYPGWIHDHQANEVDDGDYILITNGKIDTGVKPSLIDNIDDWRLSLVTWQWERLTQNNWIRWEVFRSDKSCIHLWEMRQAAWNLEMRWNQEYEEACEALAGKIGRMPDMDVLKEIFSPPFAYQPLPQKEEEYNVYRILIGGTVVRFVEGSFSIQVTVEGDLPDGILKVLKNDLVTKFSTLENTQCDIIDI